MCLLIGTVFSGERCGPWASCLSFNKFKLCTVLHVHYIIIFTCNALYLFWNHFSFLLAAILDKVCTKLKYWSGRNSIPNMNYENSDTRKPGPKRKLTKFHKFLLTLLRLKLAVPAICLVYQRHKSHKLCIRG